MARVELTGVQKIYPNGLKAIHGIDVDIADGEFIVLVGPSGCGKSTLLRMVAGLETVTEGEIRIAGRVVNDMEPADRDIAMVFQNYALYPHMTVFDNMAYGLKIRRVARDEIARRVRKAAEILELSDDQLDRKPRQLSGGQRQRVAMGRAIVREPAAFLFDEPLSNLDAKLRVQMRLEIKRLQRSLGTTSLYVTHDQIEAMTMGDRLVVMNEGRAEQIGAPMAIYDRPATIFVAGFIGSPAMNLLDGTVRGGRLSLDGGAALTLPGKAPDGPVLAGIRPEHLALAEGAPADLEIVAEAIEPLGADTLVHGRLEGGPDITVRLSGTPKLAEGDRMPLRVDPGRLHLFDPGTGARIG
jgi:sn-glycerol 3-phosphate transport system ATP-binding protein